MVNIEGRRRRRRSRHDSHRRWLGFGLTGSLLVLFFVSLFGGLRIAKLKILNEELSIELARQTRVADELAPKVRALEVGLEALIDDRMPHLQGLTYSESIPIEDDIVKTIMFIEEKQGELRRYMFNALAENSGEIVHRPQVQVVLFDEFGLQVGHGRAVSGHLLAPGDTHTLSGEIDLTLEATPAYFRVVTSDAEGLMDRVSSE